MVYSDLKDRRAGITEEEIAGAEAFSRGYKLFLDHSKTEREAVSEAVRLSEEEGFRRYQRGRTYECGDRLYVVNRHRGLILMVIGEKGLDEGINLIAAHVDSPRLDLKPRPLYEKDGFAYLDTHYYGGIKKYQWAVIPLALHGVVVKKGGERIELTAGENEGDPVFCVTDLLPHLSKDQNKKEAAAAIEGEALDLLAGSIGFNGDSGKGAVKENLLRLLLSDKGIRESDLISAEIEVVPAFKARDIGFDRSMVGAYGQDDKVCVYTALKALHAQSRPERTCVLYLTDKEETGSEGPLGAQTAFLSDFLSELSGGSAGRLFLSSRCLSADVNVALDPLYPGVTDERDTAVLNGGPVLTKYRGTGGKTGTQDATAEFLSELRTVFDEEGIRWQTGENGKIDQGGGRTIARYLGRLNIDTADLGVPILSMHSPFEVVSKIDVFAAYKAYKAFYAASFKGAY